MMQIFIGMGYAKDYEKMKGISVDHYTFTGIISFMHNDMRIFLRAACRAEVILQGLTDGTLPTRKLYKKPLFASYEIIRVDRATQRTMDEWENNIQMRENAEWYKACCATYLAAGVPMPNTRDELTAQAKDHMLEKEETVQAEAQEDSQILACGPLEACYNLRLGKGKWHPPKEDDTESHKEFVDEEKEMLQQQEALIKKRNLRTDADISAGMGRMLRNVQSIMDKQEDVD